MDDNDSQRRLRNFGVLPPDQSTLYEYDNPMTTNNDETTDDSDDRLNVDTDDFWTFDQFESQDDAHDAAAEYTTHLDGDSQ